jgi:1-deoxy-D-xylulose-5-phosphate reductoisomerase
VGGIAVLGCTGSIGDTALAVLEGLADQYRVVGLTGGTQVGKLVERARRWQPQIVCVGRAADGDQVRAALPGVCVVAGNEGLLEVVEHADVDLVLNGLVGSVGLVPTVRALRAGRTVAMANKEPLVMAGGIILAAAAAGHARLLPLDSEPNAIWQCLQGEDRAGIRRLLLTASGGPFFGRTREQLARVRPDQALAHPTWRMGAKITVDSATLMNKGFEVIEASWLFGVPTAQIEVVVHRESVVHSMVEFCDGSLLAHLGRTDMALPIQYALTHPQRRQAPVAPLDLAALGQLTFAPPDRSTFPCLDLCYEAARCGGAAPIALNAADELAVAAFLSGRLAFLDIHRVAAAVMAAAPGGPVTTLDEVLAVDAWARQRAAEEIAGAG